MRLVYNNSVYRLLKQILIGHKSLTTSITKRFLYLFLGKNLANCLKMEKFNDLTIVQSLL